MIRVVRATAAITGSEKETSSQQPMMLADPHLVLAESVGPFDQLHVTHRGWRI
jgi:hypothetical protein